MFKMYMSKYYPDNYNVKEVAYTLASLCTDKFAVFTGESGNYYIWDGFKWFSVKDKDYVVPSEDLEVDTTFTPIPVEPLKSISMRRFAVTIGSRKVAPIYNFESGTISMVGVNFEDVGHILKVNDGGNYRAFGYGMRGSEFYFEEL